MTTGSSGGKRVSRAFPKKGAKASTRGGGKALTRMQEHFAMLIAGGCGQVDAYRISHPNDHSSPNAQRVAAYELSKHPVVAARIKKVVGRAMRKAELSVERTLLEVARLAYSDPRRFYDEKGNLIPIHQLDDDAAATLAAMDIEEITAFESVIGHVKKIKLWDKNSALEKAMKYHGMFEKDNKQRGDEAVRALVEAVGANAGKFEVKP